MEMKGKRLRQGEKGKQIDKFAVIHTYGQKKEKERQTGRQRERKT